MPNPKTEITQYLIDQLGPGSITLEQAAVTWWHNIRDTGGLRLTQEGNRVLSEELAVENWSWSCSDMRGISKRLLLLMDRRLTFPYYIDRRGKRVVFYSSREAMMIALYGDLEPWLLSLPEVSKH